MFAEIKGTLERLGKTNNFRDPTFHRRQPTLKILVVYDSKSGNTEKMALAFAEGAQSAGKDVKVAVKPAEQAKPADLLAADGIIMGSPTYYGQMSGKLKQLIDESFVVHEKLAGKVGAAFTSAGGTATGAETTLLSILKAMLVHGMIVQGNAENKHYGVAALGAPKAADLKMCRERGAKVVELARKLKS
jgi:NAD(P)H dehydrogenase (quinone)